MFLKNYLKPSANKSFYSRLMGKHILYTLTAHTQGPASLNTLTVDPSDTTTKDE